MKKKLITFSDYFRYIQGKYPLEKIGAKSADYWSRLDTYLTLIQTPIELGQFVACKDGEPLEKPRLKMTFAQEEYEEALDKVLFEGWNYYKANKTNNWCISNNKLTLAFDEQKG